jgi:quercetin 2,3-dioxygenase
MEIVTWVLDGSLVHQDSAGHNGVIYPNLAQRMTAGSGIRHSEKNDLSAVSPDADRPVDLIQMWVVPDEPAGERRLTAAEPSEVLVWEMHADLGAG